MHARQHELPRVMLRVSRVPSRLLSWGVPLGPLYVLQTRGRRSGKLRRIPVVVYRYDGRRWLVSVFGETAWVANVRAAGTAELVRGRRRETIRVVEVTGDRRAIVAMNLRKSFGAIPFVRRAFAAAPRDGLAAFAAESARHPVFLIND